MSKNSPDIRAGNAKLPHVDGHLGGDSLVYSVNANKPIDVALQDSEIESKPPPQSPAGAVSGDHVAESKSASHPGEARVNDPMDQPDEYGTELHRGAKVWKVYVAETDKWDTELVDGWNKSSDVILIFVSVCISIAHKVPTGFLNQAALFSAVLAAFLIESSKKLQEDPASLSAKTLVYIAQALLTMPNGTNLPTPNTAPEQIDFVPNRVDVWINSLWYLSLSLSLVTSFVAILAKDWCQAFMSDRTGDPYSQTHRRQQKWEMIESWKMQQLLGILPSLIHIALFLFAIGLCLYLWEMNHGVAIPVILISGSSFVLYMMSSLADLKYTYFPYPTIVSRTFRLVQGKLTLSKAGDVAKIARTQLFYLVLFIGMMVIYLLLSMVQGFFRFLDWITEDISELGPALNRSGFAPIVTNIHPNVVMILSASIRGFRKLLTMPTKYLTQCIQWLDKVRLPWLGPDPFELAGMITGWTLGLADETRPIVASVSSRALSWLIENCETPRSVDIALQAISGANSTITLNPLLECEAPLKILQRLVSRDLYESAGSQAAVSLYSRALVFLSSTDTTQGTPQHPAASKIEVLLWDLQTQSDANVTSFIQEGRFRTSTHNLKALHIGTTTASRSLQVLENPSQGANEMYHSIRQLLMEHIDKRKTIHVSALLSLVHATSVLLIFAPDSQYALCPPELFVKIAELEEYSRIPQLKLMLIICALLQNANLRREAPQLRSEPGYIEDAIRALIYAQSESKKSLEIMLRLGLDELSDGTSNEYLLSELEKVQYPRPTNGVPFIPQFWNSRKLYEQAMDETLKYNQARDDIILHMQALRNIHSLTEVESIDPTVYVFVIEGLCRISPSLPEHWQVMPKLPFPALSSELIICLEQRSVIRMLAKKTNVNEVPMIFFKASQLWLLFTLAFGPTTDSQAQNKLQQLLSQCRDAELEQGRASQDLLARRMQQIWTDAGQKICDALGVYAPRLMECMHQHRDPGSPLEGGIYERVCCVPQRLRGLSSLLGQQIQGNEASSDQGEVVNGVHWPVHPVEGVRSNESLMAGEGPGISRGQGGVATEVVEIGRGGCGITGVPLTEINRGDAIIDVQGPSSNPVSGSL